VHCRGRIAEHLNNRRRLIKRPPVRHFGYDRLATCHFGATDINATLGSGINMSRAESCCTRLLLEFKSRKRFANHVLFGQVRRETWWAFFKKPLCSQQAQRILSPLRLPVPPRPPY